MAKRLSRGKVLVGAITVDGIDISGTELSALDGLTAGTVTASKIVQVDSNKDIGDFRNLDVTNLDAGLSGTAGTVDVFPTTASKGKLIISATDNTGNTNFTITNAAHGQATVVTVPDVGLATSYVVQSTAALTAAEANYLDLTTLGTGAASKAVVLDAGEDYTWPATGILTYGVLKDPAGTTLGATVAELNFAADVSARVQALTASGAVTAGVESVELDHASTVIAATIASAVNHPGLFVVKDTSATGTTAHTLTLTAGTWNGTATIATLNARDEALFVYFDSAGRGQVIANIGAVGLS